MSKPSADVKLILCCAAGIFNLVCVAFNEASETDQCWNCCVPLPPSRLPWLGFAYWYEVGCLLLVLCLGLCVAAVKLWQAAERAAQPARPTLIAN